MKLSQILSEYLLEAEVTEAKEWQSVITAAVPSGVKVTKGARDVTVGMLRKPGAGYNWVSFVVYEEGLMVIQTVKNKDAERKFKTVEDAAKYLTSQIQSFLDKGYK